MASTGGGSSGEDGPSYKTCRGLFFLGHITPNSAGGSSCLLCSRANRHPVLRGVFEVLVQAQLSRSSFLEECCDQCRNKDAPFLLCPAIAPLQAWSRAARRGAQTHRGNLYPPPKHGQHHTTENRKGEGNCSEGMWMGHFTI